MRRLAAIRFAFAVLVFGIASGAIASGQGFGGSPPWGPEKPTHFTGEVHQGEGFDYPIGNGLSFDLTLLDGYWEAGVSSSSGGDYSICATPPFRGPNAREIMAWNFQDKSGISPGGVGEKRWLEFVLSGEDDRVQCEQVDLALEGKDSFENRISGRCWFRPLSVKLSGGPPDREAIDELKFEGECALHGALELWRLPATYVIPRNVTGWVTVCFGAQGQPELPRNGDEYRIVIRKLATVRTSSVLRQDSRGAKFQLADRKAIPTEGPGQRVWGWVSGYATCGPFQSFFVGNSGEYQRNTSNPALK